MKFPLGMFDGSDFTFNDVYLAHPMSAGVTNKHEIIFREVRRGIRRRGVSVIDPSEWELTLDPNREPVREAFSRNVVSIAGSRIFLAIITGPSIGLGGELVIARSMRKPVVSLVPEPDKFRPAWAVMLSDYRFNTVDAVLQFVKAYIGL